MACLREAWDALESVERDREVVAGAPHARSYRARRNSERIGDLTLAELLDLEKDEHRAHFWIDGIKCLVEQHASARLVHQVFGAGACVGHSRC